MRFILRADQSVKYINPAYQELVRKNLAFHGKTEEEFAAGVERVIKAEQELFG